jgi:hypothetical protein
MPPTPADKAVAADEAQLAADEATVAAEPTVLMEAEPAFVALKDQAGRTFFVTGPYPVTEFDPSIKGVDTITSTGTAVPEAQIESVIAAASASGVTLERR